MRRSTVSLPSDVRGDKYLSLLDHAGRVCSKVQVVVRDTWIDEHCREVLSMLMPYLISDALTREWPGTKLMNTEARLLSFEVVQGSLDVMKQVAEGLYDWLHPRLPEDPCFFRKSGELWLATISHESDAYFELTVGELRELRSQLPDLPIVVD